MKILKLPAYYDPEQVASSHLTSDVNEAFINEGYIIENYVPIPSRGISEEVREQYKTNVTDTLSFIVFRFFLRKRVQFNGL